MAHVLLNEGGSAEREPHRLGREPPAGTAVAVLINGSPRESFHREALNAILTDLGATTLPDPPAADPTVHLDLSAYEGVYGGTDARYEVTAENGKLYLTMVRDPRRAELLRRPDRLRYELLPVTDTHFLIPPTDPAENTRTVALYDFTDGATRYLHTNGRANPRLDTVSPVDATSTDSRPGMA